MTPKEAGKMLFRAFLRRRLVVSSPMDHIVYVKRKDGRTLIITFSNSTLNPIGLMSYVLETNRGLDENGIVSIDQNPDVDKIIEDTVRWVENNA
jgi:hypothetical protein